VPHLVREVRIGRDNVDLGAQRLEHVIVVGRILDFGRQLKVTAAGMKLSADHCLEGLIGHFDELAVVECLSLKGWTGC